MRKLLAVTIVAGFMVLPASANAAPANKITICHATASSSNPWVRVAVDDNAVTKQGHDQHIHNGREDIIPPFTYTLKGVTVRYAGRSWNTEGIKIWNNGCKPITTIVATPPPVVTPTPQPPVTTTTPPTPSVVTPPRDQCPNISGTQVAVPSVMVKTENGSCVKPTPPKPSTNTCVCTPKPVTQCPLSPHTIKGTTTF